MLAISALRSESMDAMKDSAALYEDRTMGPDATYLKPCEAFVRYMFIDLSIYLSIFLYLPVSIYLSFYICLSIFLSIYIYRSFYTFRDYAKPCAAVRDSSCTRTAPWAQTPRI